MNLVCKDFEADLDVDGRVLRQQHVLRGQVELSADEYPGSVGGPDGSPVIAATPVAAWMT